MSIFQVPFFFFSSCERGEWLTAAVKLMVVVAAVMMLKGKGRSLVHAFCLVPFPATFPDRAERARFSRDSSRISFIAELFTSYYLIVHSI